MGNKITVLLLLLAGVCSGQVQCIVPDLITIESSPCVQLWNGTNWAPRQLVGMTVTSSQILLPDNSSTNEGRLTLAGNNTNGSAVVSSNTTGSTAVKVIGKGSIDVTVSNDTMSIVGYPAEGYLETHVTTLTVNNGTLTATNLTAEVEDGLNIGFEMYVMYTTGATSQGIKFRIEPNFSDRGNFWYTYDFPTTTGRQTGAVYNSNATTTIDSSTSGTNIGVIRAVAKSAAIGVGILAMNLQVAAEDGSSTVSVLPTSVMRIF